jgi:hypothetical protein
MSFHMHPDGPAPLDPETYLSNSQPENQFRL